MELTEDSLREMAEAADAGLPYTPPTEPSGAATDTASTETAEALNTEQTLQTSSESKVSSETPAAVKSPEAPKLDPNDENAPGISKYERERRKTAKEWERLNKSKTELEERERKLAERERSAPAPRQPEAAKPAPKSGYTPEDYEKAAEVFEGKGEAAKAKACREQAATLRQEAQQVDATSHQEQFLAQWDQDRDATIEKVAELKDMNTPLAKEVLGLLNNEPLFSHHPRGFSKAVEIARLKLDAARVPELTDKVQKLETEITRLNGLTAINPGNPSPPPGAGKSFDDMTTQEQEREIERKLRELEGV